MDRPLHPTLAAMIPVVDALAATFGRDCEVVLHDVSDLTSSVIAIANGHVTNRRIGSPATDLLVSIVERSDDTGADAAGTEAGKAGTEAGKAGTEKAFARDASSFLQIMIDQALSRQSKPVALLSKKDNLEVIRELDENDIFSIKHAVETVARGLNVSRYTIYNYIDEIRSERRVESARARDSQRASSAPGAPAPRRPAPPMPRPPPATAANQRTRRRTHGRRRINDGGSMTSSTGATTNQTKEDPS